MKISPFQPCHLKWLFKQGLFVEPSETLYNDILQRAKPGEIYTAYEGVATVRAIGGICSYWQGVGEAWVLYDKDLKRNLRKSFEVTKIMLLRIMKDKNFHRVQTTCKADDKRCKFLEHIGFNFQGLLPKYNPDKTDSVMYELLEENI